MSQNKPRMNFSNIKGETAFKFIEAEINLANELHDHMMMDRAIDRLNPERTKKIHEYYKLIGRLK